MQKTQELEYYKDYKYLTPFQKNITSIANRTKNCRQRKEKATENISVQKKGKTAGKVSHTKKRKTAEKVSSIKTNK